MDEIVVKLHVIDWIIVFLFLGGMIFVGFWVHRKKRGFDDYFMAGRSLTAPLLVGTLVSTFYGLDTLFGTSEVAFYEGISAFFAYSLPYTALYVVMAFLAPKFKEKFPTGTTMQEISMNKYGKGAGVLASIAAFIYSTNTMEMMGIGFLLHLVAGIPFWLGTIIGAVVVVIYTWTGGLWAVTMTDFIQFVAMMITVGFALIIGWRAIGGYERVFEGLTAWAGSAEDATYFFRGGAGYLTPWTLFAYSATAFAVLCEPAFFQRMFASAIGGYERVFEGLTAWAGSAEDATYFFRGGAGYLTPWTLFAYSATAFAVLCEPAFFQRMFASAGPKEIKKAFGVGVPMWLSFDWAVTFLGILGAAAIGLGILPEVEANQALMAIVGQYLPVGLLGVFIAGVLATAMSTADSYFLVAGGVVGYDIYKKVINPDASQEKVERLTKIGMLVSAAISIGLAFAFERIMEVWVFQATIIITTALIPVYFATFSKRPVKKIAGILATAFGLGASVIWYIWSNFFGQWSEDWEVYVIKIGNLELWQEYGIIIITPIVLIIFLIANAVGKKTVSEIEEAR